MDKIRETANEQHVKAFKIYKKENEEYAYADSDCTVKVTTSVLKNAFEKGLILIVLDTGALAKPTGYSESSSVGSITYIVPNGTTATSADIATLTGVADPA